MASLGDQQAGLAAKRHGDHGALAQAAGELPGDRQHLRHGARRMARVRHVRRRLARLAKIRDLSAPATGHRQSAS